MIWLRHLVSVLLLPVTVTVVVPAWLARRNGLAVQIPTTALEWAVVLTGGLALLVGLALFAASLARFAVQGEGTLAPWDPPKRLVAVGPYRYVRNPMISGVVFVLIGEALVLRSTPHLWWAAIFALVNLVFIAGFEERQLEQRFGESNRTYCRHVPRLLPRRTPWAPDEPTELR
jgi:protein-S-isoprenylcysteine O-methyltransferase Ste14